jgi:asparagine synthase (glutamine-hydrolysing)
MCGIVGIFSPSIEQDKSVIKTMNDAIYRRGPDDEGYYFDKKIMLGMRRLSIIDIAAGHQPIFNEDNSVVIVFNGEIYNHRELRETLIQQGHRFRTHSDTEVIVHLYEQHGIKFLDHLRGMYGICIWDINKETGFLCRDPFGIKPLFTTHSKDGAFIFGSELKSIIATKMLPKEISLAGLDAYLAYNYIPAPLTIYNNIYKLPAAHYIEFSSRGISEPIRFWDANDITANENSDTGTTSTDKISIENAIRDSVQCHMESDVAVGAFLSGGIDSSLVTAMASGHEKFTSAYTIGFENISRLYDERPLAKAVSERYKIKSHTLISVKPNPEAVLSEAILAFDEPFADDSIIPTWEICKLAAKDVKVCLTGLGGDELFGGYYRYLGIKYYESYSKLPVFMRKLILKAALLALPKTSSRKFDHMMRFLKASVLPSDQVYISYLTSLEQENRANLYAEKCKRAVDFSATIDLLKKHFNACTAPTLLQKAIYTDINSYVPEDILALSDRVSMWHSLELRVPLMDKELFAKTYGLADKYKISRHEKKIILRDIARKFLPDALFLAKKQGFESPMAEWINTELREFVNQKLSIDSLQKHGYFNPQYVQNLLAQHRSNTHDNTKLIFSLLMFQIWFEEVFLK